MKMRGGAPRGVLEWILWCLMAIGLLGMGPGRIHPRLPFGGFFGPAPLGIPTLGWTALFVVALGLILVLQLSRGEVESVDDDPPTTLNLNEE
jgi:hypothetical protein